MTLVDAGPLVALIDADEPDHVRCVRALAVVTLPMVTTCPAFTEAMYLLGRIGLPAQQALWSLESTGRLVIESLTESLSRRSAALMDKYADLPMDLADATLVALAEERDEKRIFTLDSDFTVYRFRDRAAFQPFPAPGSA